MDNTTTTVVDTAIRRAQERLEDLRQDRGITPQQSTVPSIKEAVKRSLTTIDATGPPRCEIHDTPMLFSAGPGGAPFCPTCLELETEKEEALVTQGQRDELLLRRVEGLQIGKRYRQATLGNYRPPNSHAEAILRACRSYAATISDRISCGDSLLLHGGPGTGKNHLAAAIAKEAVTRGNVVLHTTARRIGRAYRRCWDTKADQEAMLQDLIVVDLLIVDEVTQSLNPTDTDTLAEILCERYHECRPTILLANLDITALTNKLGAHIVDRFYDGKSAVLLFDWESFRGA